MLLCEYIFTPKQSGNIEDLADEVQFFMGSLIRNGQVWGPEVTGRLAGRLHVWLNVPRPDALAESHWTEWVRDAHARVVALCGEKPSWRVVDDRANGPVTETWQVGGGLYLFTHALDVTSPVSAGPDGHPVPLYLLPISQDDRWNVSDWAEEYRHLDNIQLKCGPLELEAYAELARPDSTLAHTGRALCQRIEQAAGQPTYYYLVRYWGRVKGELERPCPGCGRSWTTSAPESARGLSAFAFRCDPCRLVSDIAASCESEENAAIGDWPLSG